MSKSFEKRYAMYEESVPLLLTLTFFSVTYAKSEENAKQFGSIRMTSKKTQRNLKLPFWIVESVVKKLPLAMDRCNSAPPPTENDTLVYEQVFQLNDDKTFILSLCVTSYQEKNFCFLKPKKWNENEKRFVPQLGFIHLGSNVRDCYAFTEWLQKIKSAHLSEKVEQYLETKDFDSEKLSQGTETDLTTEDGAGPSKKRKRRSSSCEEILQNADTLDLTKECEKTS